MTNNEKPDSIIDEVDRFQQSLLEWIVASVGLPQDKFIKEEKSQYSALKTILKEVAPDQICCRG